MFKNMGRKIPGGDFLGGNFPVGNFPGGSFPDTKYIRVKGKQVNAMCTTCITVD